jgi:hypothetical protein
MSDRENAILLLGLAQGDFAHLQAFGDSPEMEDRIFGFHAQQAAEKALKSWMAVLGLKYPLTHQIRVLLEGLEEAGQNVPKDFWTLKRLTAFAVQIRYGGFLDGTLKLDRDTVLREVAAPLANVEGIVKP